MICERSPGAPTHSGRVSCVEYYHAKILYRLRNAGSYHKLLIRKDLCTLASPTPLPDGTMPLPLPAMPTPVLENAKALSEELNVPIPAPSQFSEPLTKPGEWIFSPAILQPSPTPSPALSPTPTLRNLINRGDVERVEGLFVGLRRIAFETIDRSGLGRAERDPVPRG